MWLGGGEGPGGATACRGLWGRTAAPLGPPGSPCEGKGVWELPASTVCFGDSTIQLESRVHPSVP